MRPGRVETRANCFHVEVTIPAERFPVSSRKARPSACASRGTDRPERTGPEKPTPSFELTVKAPAIAYVRFSGAPSGGYLVCDEVRFTPSHKPEK